MRKTAEFYENHSLTKKKKIVDFNNMHVLVKYPWNLYKIIGYNKSISNTL